MERFEVRSCCRDASPREARVVPEGRPARADYGDVARVIEADLGTASPDAAHHEAGHVILGIAVPGMRIWFARGCSQPVASVEPVGANWLSETVMVAAGPAAERWHRRHIFLSPDVELTATLGRVASGTAGYCDQCRIVRLVVENRPDASPGEVRTLVRAIEQAAVELVRRPAIWRAISAVADAIIEKGAVLGDEIEQIAAKYFQPGSFLLELNGLNVTLHEENT